MAKKIISAIDLFCGAGGLSFGFEKAGFNIIAGFDSCPDSLDTFLFNHKSAQAIKHDLSKTIKNLNQFKGIDIVIGGPPCQGFSISGKRNPNDSRNELYKAYIKTLKTLRPKYFVMENVPNLLSMNHGAIKEKILLDLEKLGYKITYYILNAADYGVPQNRKRVFFIGSLSTKIILHPPHKPIAVSCEEALSDLPEYSLDDGKKYISTPQSQYQKYIRKGSKEIWNHQITNHTEKTKKIIALVPDGGNYKDLPEKYRHTRKVNIGWTRFKSDKPSSTIDTGHRHHFHYKYNRVPTVRESARLQSFPDTFIFQGSKTSQYRQVGNAVPPLVAYYLAQKIMEHYIEV